MRVQVISSSQFIGLAEVQVFVRDDDGTETNVALRSGGAVASQSSTAEDLTWKWDPNNAINGVTQPTGDPRNGGLLSLTKQQSNPWWRVELPGMYVVSRVVVWNRHDCCTERLNNARVALLNYAGDMLDERTVGSTSGITRFDLDFVSLMISSFCCLMLSMAYNVPYCTLLNILLNSS